MCGQTNDELKKLCKFHQYDFNKYKGKQSKIKMARNLVDFEVGKTIFQIALKLQIENKSNQLQLL
jgi:DNA (cytosine-5)-methyltransferase 1